MHFYRTNEFRVGLKIMLNGEPYAIIENEFVKPGKGQPFNRVRLRQLLSGKKIIEKIFKSGDAVEAADIIDRHLNYLYNNGEFWYFINNQNYELVAADAKAVGDYAKWLVKQTPCVLTLWKDQPIAVVPPNFVELEVLSTDPGIKGDAISSIYKPATLTTGVIVKVPLFINKGEIIKVDTRTSMYISRVK
ncbi:elongation factor P [Candidatus Palibaumannia cicadellinicola]|uniref:Elongation factor P n=1 Tax=Baumannia cicadellinicola subsp. Homalodisca coagulata TaxID=374463 RepID=EFP_BAUCH|nr:elongation factor P [Candidatus Baumannia cicadellinicola]Q1LSP7.1 RecName: Full=Elongation factor P; Short=EF-P [Baumannia cicadellinicola str. Hc (Homalodisca coagulata)]ABF13836.1 translation elongation factor P [Baumannia cicadellinicola str. Hc (Homalodisca coagulata)]MCJ7461932.1 elongation factor P [Candidatus Baumannia cicadellinicola]MCJ7463114.1 elongation factor P [Candidatus Baumannia cicadellinicola]